MKIDRVFDLLPHYLELFGKDRPMLSDKSTGNWERYSCKDVQSLADKVSRALLSLGIGHGDKVVMIVGNQFEWNAIDFGIQQIGAVSVPVYPTITTEDYVYIFNHAETKLIITGTGDLAKKALGALPKVDTCEHVVCLENAADTMPWEEFIASGNLETTLDPYKEKVFTDDLLTIIYTSGTTGFPKGVMLTHGNLISNIVCSKEIINLGKDDKSLSFLPLCHIFERMVVYFYFYNGIQLHYVESMETIVSDLKDVGANFFTTAPRMLEKVYEKIVAKGYELKGIKRKLFFWALNLGHKYEYFTDQGLFYSIQLAIARKLIFVKWREAFGSNVKFIVSGSAALQPRLARVFGAAGIPVLEGYGLTETSPVISCNRLEGEGYRLGTVGPVLSNVEVKIAEDGEILAKGPNIMMGYYKNEEMTNEAIRDGWLYTGDIGELVEGKFLKITDRKKQMFKTSGGKYVAPQLIENSMKAIGLVDQIIVIGDGYKFPSALIVPGEDALKDFCESKGINYVDFATATASEELHLEIEKEMTLVNDQLAQWEKIKKFTILPRPFTIESGELTATLKTRRKIILEHYDKEIKEMYKA